MWGGDKKIVGVCWLPASLQVQWETPSLKNKAENDRAGCLTLPVASSMSIRPEHVHTYHSRKHTYTHTKEQKHWIKDVYSWCWNLKGLRIHGSAGSSTEIMMGHTPEWVPLINTLCSGCGVSRRTPLRQDVGTEGKNERGRGASTFNLSHGVIVWDRGGWERSWVKGLLKRPDQKDISGNMPPAGI